jgi:hypothetical protein
LTRKPTTILVLALLLTACQSKSNFQETRPVMVVWRPVGSWSGKGDSQTGSFLMEGGHWRIKWETTQEKSPGAGTFKLTVNSAVSGRPLMDAVDQRGNGRGTVDVNEDPRIFYLVIEASGIHWSATVEEPAFTQVPGSD